MPCQEPVWRVQPGAGRVGHCKLPAMNLACSGLAPNTREADWLAIAGDNTVPASCHAKHRFQLHAAAGHIATGQDVGSGHHVST